MTTVEEILTQNVPDLDEAVFDYVCGVLESPDDFNSSEDVYEAVGSVLLDSSQDPTDEEGIRDLCALLLGALKGDDDYESFEESNGNEKKLLDAPIYLGDRFKIDNSALKETNFWMMQPISKSFVDKKRLEKADAKLKLKQDKRALQEKNVSENKGVTLETATTSQATNKQANRIESAGGLQYDIKIENFDLSYGSRVLLAGASLSLTYGRRYGLVGRNGIGKSTLLRSMASRQLHLPAHLSILHVEQEVVGDDTVAVESVLECDEERTALLKREKELVVSLAAEGSSSTAGENTELAQVYARLHDIEADQAPAKASRILAGLGFNPEMQKRKTREFSGGWRMRLALAKALFARPDLLLLDEPTNMLDIRAVLWLEDYLQTWPSTILVVSHDHNFLNSVATDTLYMHSQRIDYYRGNYETFLAVKADKLKNQQREYEAQMQYRQHLQDYVDRWRYNAKRAPQAQSKLKILEKLPELKPVVTEAEVVLKFPETEKLAPPILQLSEVSFSYTPDVPIFKKISLYADMESRIALVGENGTGKSTLLKLLTDELSPLEGYRQAHRNLHIAVFTQHHVDQLVMDTTPLQLIQSKFPGETEEQYRHQLGSFGVSGELAMRPVVSLSGGQKSRVAFALMAMTRPNFLILDEPTNHLDLETVEALAKALKKFKGGVILVSHDEHLINLACNEVWLCKNHSVYRLDGGLQQYKSEVENEFRSS
ncbi:hypothetical protein EMCRGX_G016598 [Ephydatia muelleri]